jgi:HTH-type transcriptional regulator/antitoxin HigA
MNAKNDLLVPHPGEFIREELEARQWTQRDLAFVLGKEESAVNALIAGRRGVSPEMAKALGDAFDVNPEFFMNLQRSYDLSRAPQPDPGVARRARFQEFYPVREMMNRGWLARTGSEEIEIQLTRYFKVDDPSKIPHMRHSAKKTHYEECSPAQVAWLFRARQIAETMLCEPYSEAKLRNALSRLKALMIAPEEVRHVPRILAECGVRFIVIEALPGSKIAGVCFWLDKTAPVIALSVQRDQIDSFWFDLRHEIEHVLQKHGQQQECIDPELGDGNVNVSAEEAVANREAQDFCVQRAELEDFVARVNPYFGEQRITLFAQRLKIHPGIVVGQLQKRLDRWDLLKKMQPKVRQYLTSSAIADGWGTIYPIDL